MIVAEVIMGLATFWILLLEDLGEDYREIVAPYEIALSAAGR